MLCLYVYGKILRFQSAISDTGWVPNTNSLKTAIDTSEKGQFLRVQEETRQHRAASSNLMLDGENDCTEWVAENPSLVDWHDEDDLEMTQN
ncbi:hypothetical protein BT69DRAFT_1289506 [Atractiella rhizophila]|nr:hypothetical protein BT69DRAFT_1289506 [Atractiella rhizophila]